MGNAPGVARNITLLCVDGIFCVFRIEVYDMACRPVDLNGCIFAHPHSVNDIAESGTKNDVRTPDKLVDGKD